ncbi:MAG: hypothetical protein IT281_07690 [Ignavibacteria bacterium]|nr:hypothetical protein [Ignavibacteria bacterium]MCC7159403.1 hypothetical protein [Ignavibacteria bacterium]
MKVLFLFAAIFSCLSILLIQDSYSDTGKINNPGDSSVLKLTAEILEVIKDRNYAELAEFFHPESGVRFSPYAYIDTAVDLVFTKKTFYKQFKTKSSSKLIWGYYDGSGDTIRLSIDDYFKKFVYDVDFLNAEITTVNNSSAHGNTINNLAAIYDGLQYTESYFSGFDEKFGGMDWRALRLVYEEYKGKYYLVGIIHDEWTI